MNCYGDSTRRRTNGTNEAPADQTARQHVGMVKKSIFTTEDPPFSILGLTDGRTVTISQHESDFNPGVRYKFVGQWTHGKYGWQFQAVTATIEGFVTRAGVTKYLVEKCSGIGAATAGKLWDKFGPEAVEVLKSNPSRAVAEVGIRQDVAEEASRDLVDHTSVEQAKLEMYGLIAGTGLPRKAVDYSILKWGARAPAIVQADPYKLLTGGIPGCGWIRCDKLYLKNGGRPTATKRHALATWYGLTSDRGGNTWLPLGQVRAIADQAVPGGDSDRALTLARRAGLIHTIMDDNGVWWAAEASGANAEVVIAQCVARTKAEAGAWPTEWPTSRSEDDGLPSQHQIDQLKQATRTPIGCFCGGPGTGKTHTIRWVVKTLQDNGGASIAVCAPTGKAAVRANEALGDLGIKASTIHKLIGFGQSPSDQRSQQTRVENLDYLIVDESSMVDSCLLASLLCKLSPRCRVLLVGDPDQLPPVGRGAPFRDLIASGVVGVGTLTETRRNSGDIVRACAAIRSAQPVTFAERMELDAADPKNLRFLGATSTGLIRSLEKIIASITRFNVVKDCQVLVATNDRGDNSRKKINESLGNLLNPTAEKVQGIPFRIGDKVICLKNGKYAGCRMPEEFEKANLPGGYRRSGADEYIANGEIGYCLVVDTSGVVIDFDGTTVFINKGKPKKDDDRDSDNDDGKASRNDEEPKGVFGNFDFAWAITTHKSQGGEWPLVIVIADPAGAIVADRHWWYTALSRAKKACLVVGDREAFEVQSRRQSLVNRKTFLVKRLIDAQQNNNGAIDRGEERRRAQSWAALTLPQLV